MTTEASVSNAPFSYENWQAHNLGAALQDSKEYPLFSDTHIIGGKNVPWVKYGPYRLINAFGGATSYPARPAIILRVDNHLNFEMPEMNASNTERYHGGFLSDEIAALVSLCLGIRLKAGSANRVFWVGGDPKGQPMSLGLSPDPVLPIVRKQPILPRAIAEHNIEDTAILGILPNIPASAAGALIRAARLYQEALWIIESTPELSWIMLTSSIETAANYWGVDNSSPLERLKSVNGFQPLVTLIESATDEKLAGKAARILARFVGSTSRFVGFVMTFLPSPPSARPPEFSQLSWEPEAMQQAMTKIYGYRSSALHEGRPFPEPMSFPPRTFGLGPVPQEIPEGLAVGSKGSVWMQDDLPMLIHTFEYIVRGALLNWWSSLPPVQDGNSS